MININLQCELVKAYSFIIILFHPPIRHSDAHKFFPDERPYSGPPKAKRIASVRSSSPNLPRVTEFSQCQEFWDLQRNFFRKNMFTLVKTMGPKLVFSDLDWILKRGGVDPNPSYCKLRNYKTIK